MGSPSEMKESHSWICLPPTKTSPPIGFPRVLYCFLQRIGQSCGWRIDGRRKVIRKRVGASVGDEGGEGGSASVTKERRNEGQRQSAIIRQPSNYINHHSLTHAVRVELSSLVSCCNVDLRELALARELDVVGRGNPVQTGERPSRNRSGPVAVFLAPGHLVLLAVADRVASLGWGPEAEVVERVDVHNLALGVLRVLGPALGRAKLARLSSVGQVVLSGRVWW